MFVGGLLKHLRYTRRVSFTALVRSGVRSERKALMVLRWVGAAMGGHCLFEGSYALEALEKRQVFLRRSSQTLRKTLRKFKGLAALYGALSFA